ncbi:MAG: hydroxymethylglutaryl-CoA synthase [Candidatus Micrarchaeia archaeon]
MFKGVGIVSYGVAVPRMRIKVSEIARVWGKDGEKVSKGLGVREKTVASFDEDSCTLAVEASRVALRNQDASRIGAVFVGSESKPYAVKPTASIVAEAIGASPELTGGDLEFACKAGTASMQACLAMVASDMVEYGLAIGSDTAQGRPGDALEFSAGSGAAAVLIGRNPVAEFIDTYSYTTDTPDFWRRQHAEFPRHAGRFTGEPAYFKHVVSAGKGLLAKTATTPEDYDYAVFHQPNGKFPLQAAKLLGFPEEKVKQGLLTPLIGNTYSAAAMIGFASVLDVAEPGQKIFMVSYGSGAGSDAFAFEVKDGIKEARPEESVLALAEKDKVYVDYAVYAKHRRKLKTL